MLHARLEADLARSGARVLLLDTSAVDSTLDGLDALAAAVGDETVLKQRAAALRAELAALRLERPVPVLALFGTPGSFQVVTERTWIGSLLDTLHFEPRPGLTAAARASPASSEVSDEKLATLRPELVLLVAHGDPTRIREELGAHDRRRRSLERPRQVGDARRARAAAAISSSRTPASAAARGAGARRARRAGGSCGRRA